MNIPGMRALSALTPEDRAQLRKAFPSRNQAVAQMKVSQVTFDSLVSSDGRVAPETVTRVAKQLAEMRDAHAARVAAYAAHTAALDAAQAAYAAALDALDAAHAALEARDAARAAQAAYAAYAAYVAALDAEVTT